MKILFDIWHLPQYNFFHNVFKQIEPDCYALCIVKRGKLPEIINYELPDSSVYIFEDYSRNNSTFTLIFKVILPRIWAIYKLVKKEKYDFIISASYQSNIIAKLLGIPNVAFNDDPEKINFKIVKLFADKVIIPPLFKNTKGVLVMNALKEWAYLSPKYFNPNDKVLTEYSLQPKNYIFIREVSNTSLNYNKQEANVILKYAHSFPKKFTYVLSLEDKSAADLYPKEWIILNEPVSDIHSLMYYSACVISSGDSMAREGALLGVHSIYCGDREMRANSLLYKKKMMHWKKPAELAEILRNLDIDSDLEKEQIITRRKLLKEWDDVTEFILKIIKDYKTH